MAIHKPHARETTLRHLWLAGLGLVWLLRSDAFATRTSLSAQARQWPRRAREAADPAGFGAPAAVVARGRIREAITLLDEGIGARQALRPKANPALERGGATEGQVSGSLTGRARHVRRPARIPRPAPTARAGQSR